MVRGTRKICLPEEELDETESQCVAFEESTGAGHGTIRVNGRHAIASRRTVDVYCRSLKLANLDSYRVSIDVSSLKFKPEAVDTMHNSYRC
jgi:hypothetical protein